MKPLKPIIVKLLITSASLLLMNACTALKTQTVSIPPQIAFVNIENDQTISGILPRSPGITILEGKIKELKLEFVHPDGRLISTRTKADSTICITGDVKGICNSFNTKDNLDGTYTIRARITTAIGTTLKDEIRFNIKNGSLATPEIPDTSKLPDVPELPPTPLLDTKVAWNNVKSWGIQYQKFDIDNLKPIADSGIDLVVLGSKDGWGRDWTSENIASVTKKVWLFQYISAGQAESHEWYFQKNWLTNKPSWILNEWNAVGSGVYNVMYWDNAWQDILKQGIDRMIDKGFDGAFLDQADSYWNPGFPGGPSIQNMQHSRDLVCDIAHYARTKKPDFKIFVNGGTNQYDRFGSSYADCFDATAGEHLWYLNTGIADKSGYVSYTIPLLEQLVKEGKKVFTFDYTSNATEINQTISESRNKGFIPTITDAAISTTPVLY